MSDVQKSGPPKDSQPAAGVPSGGGGKGLIGLGAALLLLGGGLVFWKTQQKGETPEEITKTTPITPQAEPSAPALAEPPPPPPPEEEVAPEKTDVSAPKTGGAKVPSGCSGSCAGTETAALLSALSAKAGQARTCYNRALRVNSSLEGKIRMSVRVGPTGNACSATVAEDSLHDPGVSSCVAQMFRSSSYPSPKGGCVDVSIPINFVAK